MTFYIALACLYGVALLALLWMAVDWVGGFSAKMAAEQRHRDQIAADYIRRQCVGRHDRDR